jgi:hypothetical protein
MNLILTIEIVHLSKKKKKKKTSFNSSKLLSLLQSQSPFLQSLKTFNLLCRTLKNLQTFFYNYTLVNFMKLKITFKLKLIFLKKLKH